MDARIAALCAMVLLGGTAARAQTQRLWPPGQDPECPGCYVQQVEVAAAPGAAAVAATEASCQLRANLDFLSTVLLIVQPRIGAAVSGNLLEAAKTLKRPVLEGLREEVAADFRQVLGRSGAVSPFATCLPVGALLPRGAEVVGVDLAIVDAASAVHVCAAEQARCEAEAGRVILRPTVIERQGRSAVVALLEHSPASPGSWGARMRVLFRMTPGHQAEAL